MKEKIKQIQEKALAYATENSPAILTGIGVVGVFTTAVMAYKAGPKAQVIIEQHKANNPQTKEEKRAETISLIKDLAPVILPPIGMGVATSACIIGSNQISTRRLAVLSAAYSLSEQALKDYQNKVEELVDSKKVQKVKESIAKDRLEKDPITDDREVYETGDGDVLCYDDYSGRYFKSNSEKIGRVFNEISADVNKEMWVDLNELYIKLNIPAISAGEDVGFSVDDLDNGNIRYTKSAQLSANDKPCLVLIYKPSPYLVFQRKI